MSLSQSGPKHSGSFWFIPMHFAFRDLVPVNILHHDHELHSPQIEPQSYTTDKTLHVTTADMTYLGLCFVIPTVWSTANASSSSDSHAIGTVAPSFPVGPSQRLSTTLNQTVNQTPV